MQFIHDPDTRHERGAKVPGSPDCIHLEQIVRSYPHQEQFPEKLFQGIWVVVDAPQKDGLVTQRDPGIGKNSAGFPGLGRYLGGVIEVGMYVQRRKTGEQGRKISRYPLRIGGRDSCSDPKDLHMGDIPDLGKDLIQPFIFQHEGVAARKKHVSDPGMLFYVIDPLPNCFIGNVQ